MFNKKLPPIELSSESSYSNYYSPATKPSMDTLSDSQLQDLLIKSCIFGDLPLLQQLIKKKIDLNQRDSLGFTPLIQACRYSNMNCLLTLIHHGALINQTDSQGLTPLMHAVFIQRLDIVETLIFQGADFKLKDHQGLNALMHAYQQDFGEIFEYLTDQYDSNEISDINHQYASIFQKQPPQHKESRSVFRSN